MKPAGPVVLIARPDSAGEGIADGIRGFAGQGCRRAQPLGMLGSRCGVMVAGCRERGLILESLAPRICRVITPGERTETKAGPESMKGLCTLTVASGRRSR